MATAERPVPDGLWETFLNVAPKPPTRVHGGGRRRCDDRAVLAAIILVARYAPGDNSRWFFGASWRTVHRGGPRRRRPAKPHADKGFDFDHLRNWLRQRRIVFRRARRGGEPSARSGGDRWGGGGWHGLKAAPGCLVAFDGRGEHLP